MDNIRKYNSLIYQQHRTVDLIIFMELSPSQETASFVAIQGVSKHFCNTVAHILFTTPVH
jgi:hypothetical protein